MRWSPTGVLVDDPDRIGEVTALGLDETLFCRRAGGASRSSAPSTVDVSPTIKPSYWTSCRAARRSARPLGCKPNPAADWTRSAGVYWICPGPYRKTFDDLLPDVVQVADAFYASSWATPNSTNASAGCGTKHSNTEAAKTTPYIGLPGCWSKPKKALTTAARQAARAAQRRRPHVDVRLTWHAKKQPAGYTTSLIPT
jgi:hypothetical protein